MPNAQYSYFFIKFGKSVNEIFSAAIMIFDMPAKFLLAAAKISGTLNAEATCDDARAKLRGIERQTDMPTNKTVTLRYSASEEFWEVQCRAICALSIREQRTFSLPSLLTHVAEKKLKELGRLTAKDLLCFASSDAVRGEIPINIGVDKWVNDQLRRVRWRLSAESGTRVTNIQLHRLAFYIIIGS